MTTNYDYFEPFESGRTRARLAIGFLAACIVIHLISVGSLLLQINLLYKVAEGTTVTPDELIVNDTRQRLIAIVQLLVYLTTAIFFLMWIHRAYRNLKPLGVANPDYSPGWAAGYFLIPIVNLVRPHQIVQEIWRESDPETVVAGGAQQSYGFVDGPAKSFLVIFWWLSWIISNILDWFAFRIEKDANSLDDLLGASWISLVADVINIIAAIACILVIKKIDDKQEERLRRLAQFAAPPDNFAAGPQAWHA